MEKEKIYYYDDEYYSLEEICEKYKKLPNEQKKQFRDCLAHFTLVQIFKICNYDERYIDYIFDLAQTESSLINMHGGDCGRVTMALNKSYKSTLRKLINLTGKVAGFNDNRTNKFINGEWMLNNLVCLTLGNSFEKEVIGDLFLIDCDSFSEDECLAIANNFVRYMRNEEIVFYNAPRRLK